MFLLSVHVKSPLTQDSRGKAWRFEFAALDAPAMQRLRTQILAWCDELNAADSVAVESPKDL